MNTIDITNLTETDMDALFAVMGDEDGYSLEGLSPLGKAAVTAAFKAKGITVHPWYFSESKESFDGERFETKILKRQERHYLGDE